MLIGALPAEVRPNHASGGECSEKLLVNAGLALGIHRLNANGFESIQQLLRTAGVKPCKLLGAKPDGAGGLLIEVELDRQHVSASLHDPRLADRCQAPQQTQRVK